MSVLLSLFTGAKRSAVFVLAIESYFALCVFFNYENNSKDLKIERSRKYSYGTVTMYDSRHSNVKMV